MSQPIAIVGVACRYPDASSPAELWENVLAGRRAFRRIPDERISLEDYYSSDPTAPDKFYSRKAAVIDGFEFDRVKYKIAGSTYRTTDMAHWLALDTAARALDDAGFPEGAGLPRENTTVVIGNSLNGEFSRANLMRLRWPYVRRTLSGALRELGWEDAKLASFLCDMEVRYKSSFPPVDEDTLAGGLSNTIAGRICNQFDFKGGGFTVDGACSSSLLAVITACNGLRDGYTDAAVVGGVDLSIDPFEIIGFAKTGALAKTEMRIYDQHSNGFWPGEGCGMLVLVRQQDAEARGLRTYATIDGWGYSSDGKGGITRPVADGHKLALSRAYRVAGYDIGSVGYLEGHGTGTPVGDTTELQAFSEARRAARPGAAPVPIGSVKGNIGHTKAAAGVAGLIKATMAVYHQVIPPATSHIDPHPLVRGESAALRVPLTAEPWPDGQPIRAGVSAMGFGGINTHVVIAAGQDADTARRTRLDSRTARLAGSRQDAELLLMDAASTVDLRGRLARLAELCGRIAFAELGDLAATLAGDLAAEGSGERPVRAAIVASSPEQAEERIGKLLILLDDGVRKIVDPASGVFLGEATLGGTSGRQAGPRIGYMFPGQGSGKGTGDVLRRRFAVVDELYAEVTIPVGDTVATAVAQPRIIASSLAGLRLLDQLGIEANAALGHSLGELAALHWAGAMDEQEVLALATERGRVMTEASTGGGAMAGIAAGPEQVAPLLRGEHEGDVVIAGYNGPRQTVISGLADAVERVRRAAEECGIGTVQIRVSHAFHSPFVAPAAAGLDEYLADREFRPLTGRVVSTVTGGGLAAGADLRDLLVRQVRAPVRFSEALGQVAADADLLIEVGPGRVLSGLAASIAPDTPVVALDTDAASLSGVLAAVAAAYALGAPVRTGELFAGRFTRPLPVEKEFRFFASPCESVSADTDVQALIAAAAEQVRETRESQQGPFGGREGASTLDVLRRLAAERAELPLESVRADSHPLDGLHLSSITVGQIMSQAARELGISAPVVSSNFATSTLEDLARALDELAATSLPSDTDVLLPPDGAEPWVRAFEVVLTEVPEPGRAAPPAEGSWQVFAPSGHPLAEPLAHALDAEKLGDGVLLCLPVDCGPGHVGLMLQAARTALDTIAGGAERAARPARFVCVQDQRGAAGLAKTLHLEAPAIPVTVITLPLAAETVTEWAADLAQSIAADVAATETFLEVSYDAAGTRRRPALRPVTDLAASSAPLPIGAGDVLLVTGGGKGITAECALDLAKSSGTAVALLGRSDPDADAELAANLRRFEAAGVRYAYVRADVTSAEAVRRAVAEVTGSLGPVTAVLHGAGRNTPVPLRDLTEDAFLATLGPKIGGLEAVLAAVDPGALRLLVTFGSIIGRAGLRGQADYATANDWLTQLTRQVQDEHPGCRCVALEWSVWSGAGMGERLGVLESLTREGISPISLDGGLEILRQVLASPHAPGSMVVMGRAGGLPTISLEPRDLPLTRFIDQPRVYYPGIELVADVELSANSDPYLADHLLDGDLLFPAVLGMEAMAQAGAALAGGQEPPLFEDMEFLRPIVVPADGSAMVRIAAVNRGDSVVVAIRSADTGFQADHFRATLRYGAERHFPAEQIQLPPCANLVPLDPEADLYGPVLFQGRRFQRLTGYRRLAATSCTAEISTGPQDEWFASYLPGDLLLGNPGSRDAFMHAIQCCVPNATLLPAGVERLYPAPASSSASSWELVLCAKERGRVGDTFTYDLDVCALDGRILERWEGLRLQAVRKTDGRGPWVPALLGPYLERQAAELLPCAARVVVEPAPALVPGDADGAPCAHSDAAGDAGTSGDVARRRRQTDAAVSRMLGRPTVVTHRGDGKPEVADAGVGLGVSASHADGVTLAVMGAGRVGCDAETVRDLPAADWRDLLGAEQFALAELVSRERGDDLAVAATRVWGAVECLRKVGRVIPGPVTFSRSGPDGWVLFQSGRAGIASFATRLRDEPGPVVFTILTEG